MPRLMDMGLERLSNAIADMGTLAQESVLKAIQAYAKGEQITQEAFDRVKPTIDAGNRSRRISC